MVAHALHHRIGATVAHAEALAANPAEVRLARGCSIKRDVADDDVFFRHEGCRFRREHHDLSTRQTLADVIVGIALERQGDPARNEGTKALSGGAIEMDLDGVVRQTIPTMPTGQFVAKNRAHGTIDVADRQGEFHRLPMLQCRPARGTSVRRSSERSSP